MMPTLKHRSFYFFLIILSIPLSFFLGAMPPGQEKIEITHFDKIMHFVYYFALATFTTQVLDQKKAFTFLFILGLAVEIMQYFIEYRSAELLDLVANTLGIFSGLIVIKKYSLYYLERLERVLTRVK